MGNLHIRKNPNDGSVPIALPLSSGIARWFSVRNTNADDSDLPGSFAGAPDSVAMQLVFGGCKGRRRTAETIAKTKWPVLWINGNSEITGGVQTLVLEGVQGRPLLIGDRVAGRCFSDSHADYCYLGGVLPSDIRGSRPAQAEQVFARIERLLEQVDMKFSNVVRTWFFIDRITDWYGDFNLVRNGFFRKRAIYDGLVPASTGIGAANHAGAALVAGTLAVRPKKPDVRIEQVASPLQGPALNYGSSFSRAVEIRSPEGKCLFVSGTASIGENESTVFEGDLDGQIGRTMSVVEALLRSRGMAWSDVTRGIVYFNDAADVPRFEAYCRAHNLPPLPVVNSHAAICRRDLLFEIEVDAAKLDVCTAC